MIPFRRSNHQPPTTNHLYYGRIVGGVTALALLVSAGVRSAPGVLIHPLANDLGWDRSGISLGVSIGLLLFGLADTGTGWLTDRYDPRKLLAVYYSLRGLSLFLLPAVTSIEGLALFAIVFGLDYIATVPPTAALTADIFGRRNVGAVFGWVFFAHQLGATLAAYGGGLTRDLLGDYTAAFLAAGLLAILGGLMALRIGRDTRPAISPDPLPAPA